ncbi:hypothetical protein NDU88_005473 [Pleurodeles waltl]|uniref:Uncharacterized protein n=1 Tax=Pleurodeles waltl TaxID=8319 RepID=A0AAV7LMS3_PLEWA|nr:hypothetical protein NDU88_005473 [Pleurodeles waltl]
MVCSSIRTRHPAYPCYVAAWTVYLGGDPPQSMPRFPLPAGIEVVCASDVRGEEIKVESGSCAGSQNPTWCPVIISVRYPHLPSAGNETHWRREWAFLPSIIAWCVLVAVTAAGVCMSTRLAEAVSWRCAQPCWALSPACPRPLCLLAWGPFNLLWGWAGSAEGVVAPPTSRSTCCKELFQGLNTACPGYISHVGWNLLIFAGGRQSVRGQAYAELLLLHQAPSE